MNWYLDVLKQYAVFNGRARRAEYWYFVLFNLIISIVLGIVDGMMGSSGVGVLGGLYTLAVLIPSLAVSVRRLHDTNRSGWWLLLLLIPLIGALVILLFTVQDGTPGENNYGADPKARDALEVPA